MDLKETFKLLVTLLALSLLVLLCSCGSRKVQKSVVKESTTTERTASEKKDIETKTETQTVINNESSELEITPIDTAKVLVINGKIYKNAKVKILNRKSNTTIAEKATVKDLTKSETKAIIAVKKQDDKLDSERKSNPLKSLLGFIIGFSIYFIWKYRYKLIGL